MGSRSTARRPLRRALTVASRVGWLAMVPLACSGPGADEGGAPAKAGGREIMVAQDSGGSVPTTIAGPGGSVSTGPGHAEAGPGSETDPERAPGHPIRARGRPVDSRELAEQVSITARVARTSFRPLEPIVVGFEIRNSTPFTIQPGGPGLPDLKFAVKVLDEGGREVAKTAFYRAAFEASKEPTGSNPPASLRSGETMTTGLVANWPYDLTAPGRYTIAILLPCRIRPGGEEIVVVSESNPVQVEVIGDPIELLHGDDLPFNAGSMMDQRPPDAIRPGLGP